MKNNINWAVLGTGVIANEMAVALNKMGKKIYSVGNRTYEKAVSFAKKYGIEKIYDDFNDMFFDDEVDVIYITTPHNTHIDFIKKALNSNKHVLVEKSITLNNAQLDAAISLANSKGLILMEAMTLYHMPLYKKLDEIISSNKYGRVNLITTNFGSFKEYNMENRFFNKSLAGGAMLDIGVYALSLTRFFMEKAPNEFFSQVKFAPTGVDEQATIILKNSAEQMATVTLSLHSKQPKRAVISCEKAYIEIMEYPRAIEATITDSQTMEKETISCIEDGDALYFELLDMENAINGDTSNVRLNYTKDVMDIMTKIRYDWNMIYDEEK